MFWYICFLFYSKMCSNQLKQHLKPAKNACQSLKGFKPFIYYVFFFT